MQAKLVFHLCVCTLSIDPIEQNGAASEAHKTAISLSLSSLEFRSIKSLMHFALVPDNTPVDSKRKFVHFV